MVCQPLAGFGAPTQASPPVVVCDRPRLILAETLPRAARQASWSQRGERVVRLVLDHSDLCRNGGSGSWEAAEDGGEEENYMLCAGFAGTL